MVALAEIEEFSFAYPEAEKATLQDVSLVIERGDFIVLAGSSGSGKTTLLRHLKRELWPVGTKTGTLYYQNQPYVALDKVQSTTEIVMVFQNPENQLVMDNVMGELAFALENTGCAPLEIQKKIAEFVHFFGFQDLLEQSIHTLSGGQKQLVNLAAVLILQPKLLILDEPTANLDPVATQDFLGILKRVHEEFGVTVIMSEHRLDEVLPLATKLIVMEAGKIKYNAEPTATIRCLWQAEEEKRLFIPQIPRLFLELQLEGMPFSVLQAQKELPLFVDSTEKTEKTSVEREVILQAKGLDFQYEKKGVLVLENLSLKIHQGDWFGLVGKNGTGKSTLLMVLAGLLKRRRGSLNYQGKSFAKLDLTTRYQSIGYVSQNPMYHFAYETVQQELVQRGIQLDLPEAEKKIEQLVNQLGIKAIMKQNPLDCSGGEQQLIALALALMSKPKILLLDEPTKGLDPVRKVALGKLLTELNQSGLTIVMATHDMEFAAAFSNRVGMLFDGRIISEGSPAQFFSDNFFYTTAINRVVRKSLPQALIWEDVIPFVEK